MRALASRLAVLVTLSLAVSACTAPEDSPGGGDPAAVPPLVTIESADASVATTEDNPVIFDLAATVTGSQDAPVFSVLSGPKHGKLTLAGAKATYTPDADYYGTDELEYEATVGEHKASGKISIQVDPVNDAPAFTPGANVTVLEDAGSQSLPWATALAAGPDNEADQLLIFTVTNNQTALFAAEPAIGADGNLTFTPAQNANGTATVMVVLGDSGGDKDKGVDHTAAVTFTITVQAVNDVPSFTHAGAVSLLEDAGAQSLPGRVSAISNGPADEGAQVLTFDVTNDNNGLFSAQPSVAPDGTLTFTAAPNANGSATVTVSLQDDGGTANGGLDVTSSTFTLTVTPVNDVPAFTKGANVSVLEDAGAQTTAGWATNIGVGPSNESAQSHAFVITNDNNSLFSAQPTVATDGTLTFTPLANANGLATVSVRLADSGGTADGGVSLSAVQTFTITVTPVNDVPSFTAGSNVTVLEDSGASTSANWATLISAGPSNESAQTVAFIIGNDNTALFSSQPTVATDGTLSFTPAADANGSATVTLRIADSGGTSNGGSDQSASQTFTITVTAVNDVPSFSKGVDVTVLEDSGAASTTNWATARSAGPADEAAQLLAFVISNDNNGLFASQPTVTTNGNLSFTPAANAFGTATVTVRIGDTGGTANGGVALSAAQTFTITVTPVNDVPSFTKGADITVLEDSGIHSNASWATAISVGPVNEAGQSRVFVISNDNGSLFSSPPTVGTNGALSFTPAAHANGSATVTLQVKDSGGTGNGGVDVSATQTFTIDVTPVNDAPAFVKGADQTVLEDAGVQTITSWATAISAGPADESAQAVTFAVTNDNNSLFLSQPAVASNGTLAYTPAAHANGAATITVTAFDNGGIGSGGSNASAAQTFTLTVTAVNDAPAFTKGADETPLEDSGVHTIAGWATTISTGPANESAQAVTFATTNDNSGLFSVQPSVAANGNLSYTLAANSNGTATVTVRAWDNGGTANGGTNSSGMQTFTLSITSVNDAPAFTPGASISVIEDPGTQSFTGWATSISPGAPNESSQSLAFVVSNDNTALFATQPTVSVNGTLTFRPALHGHGSATITLSIADSGGTANGGVDASALQTFTITVTPVNDAPAFTKGVNQVVLEDSGAQAIGAWATGISAGAPSEAGQTLDFIVTNSNNSLFAVQPSIDPAGNLAYTPAPNANGSATVSVKLHDDGGATDGGVDTSGVQLFSITLGGVNDAPLFTKGADITNLYEDAGATSIPGWATGLNAGASDELWQTITLVMDGNTNPGLFAVAPSVNGAGDLTFTPAAHANGSATITLHAQDNGGTASGGNDTSGTQSFVISIGAVNDAPAFTTGSDVYVFDTAGAQTNSWATSISTGPSDEAAQTVTFSTTNDNNALFTAQPSIDNAGVLTFTPAIGQQGLANVALTAWDNGGTANGGANTYGVTFKITVDNINDAPSFTGGGDVTVLEDSGSQSNPWAASISAGPGEFGQVLTFQITGNTNSGLFSAGPSIDDAGVLHFTPASEAHGASDITVQLQDDGGGSDTSAPVTFTINVTPVNDAPSFTVGVNQQVNEDSGPQTVAGFATTIVPGPGNESAQAVTFSVTTNKPALFSGGPAVSATGELTYTPAAHQFGLATVTVRAWDNGDTANGGIRQSGAGMFSIDVDSVNDTPSFSTPVSFTVLEDDPNHDGQNGISMASLIAVGPANELNQSYSFTVTAAGAFQCCYYMDNGGTLYFNVGWGTYTSDLYITLQDTGGSGNGAVDSTTRVVQMVVLHRNHAPDARPDVLSTLVDQAGDVCVLCNDSDRDSDPITVLSFTQGFNGSVMTMGGGMLRYTPNPGYSGPDSFDYTATDGTESTIQTVDVWVGPDTLPPNFIAASSQPQNGATLNNNQAFGGFGGGGQINPARFVFDDPFLDMNGVIISLSYAGVPLLESTDYWVDNGSAGEIRINWNVYSFGTLPQQGAPLEFHLSNVKDTFGNLGADVNVSVFFDGVSPQATWLSGGNGSQNLRAILQWNEPISAPSVSAFVYKDETTGLDVMPDPVSGTALFSLAMPNDAFYFVPDELPEQGHHIRISARDMTDLAGNPSQGMTDWDTNVCCTNNGGPRMLRLDFVNRITLAVTRSYPVTDAPVLVDGAEAGQDDLLFAVFDSELVTTSNASNGRLESREIKAGGNDVAATFITTSQPNDTMVFDLNPSVWEGKSRFQIRFNVQAPALDPMNPWGPNSNGNQLFAILGDASDITAPTLTALVASDSTGPTGAVALLRPAEALLAGFSERIDVATLAASHFAILGPLAVQYPVITTLEDSATNAVRLRAADPAGKPLALPPGNYTLRVSGVKDLASPQNTSTPLDIPFVVAASARPAAQFMFDSITPQFASNSTLELGFTDRMDHTTLRDTGPLENRGLRLEDKWGMTYIPLKGYQAVVRGLEETSLVRIGFEQNCCLTPGTEYRLSLNSKARNIDGKPLTNPITFHFATAATNEASAPQLEYGGIGLQDFLPTAFLFGGSPMGSRLDVSAYIRDNDFSDSWQLSLTPITGAAITTGFQSNQKLDTSLGEPDMSATFAQGMETFYMLYVTDSTGLYTWTLGSAYRMSTEGLAGSSPYITPGPQPGTFTISGSVTNVTDAAHIRKVDLIFGVADVSSYPFNMVDLRGIAMAQVGRNADGTLWYSFTTPTDFGLSPLPAPYSYVVAPDFELPPTIGNGDSRVDAIGAVSTPFNP